MKDDKYWARRRKNNMAAKRSRDARRVKENQIAMRAAFLEKEVVSALFQLKIVISFSSKRDDLLHSILLPLIIVVYLVIFLFFSSVSVQNAVLKAELEKVTKLYTAALKRLEQYEKPGKKC